MEGEGVPCFPASIKDTNLCPRPRANCSTYSQEQAAHGKPRCAAASDTLHDRWPGGVAVWWGGPMRWPSGRGRPGRVAWCRGLAEWPAFTPRSGRQVLTKSDRQLELSSCTSGPNAHWLTNDQCGKHNGVFSARLTSTSQQSLLWHGMFYIYPDGQFGESEGRLRKGPGGDL